VASMLVWPRCLNRSGNEYTDQEAAAVLFRREGRFMLRVAVVRLDTGSIKSKLTGESDREYGSTQPPTNEKQRRDIGAKSYRCIQARWETACIPLVTGAVC